MTSEYYIKKTSNAQLKLEMQLTNGNKRDFYTMPQVNGKWQRGSIICRLAETDLCGARTT